MKASGDHLPSVSPLAEDPINTLPNCLIQSILSLLPLKDAARASLVSTRWRRLWTSAPLCIDDSSLHLQPSTSGDNTNKRKSRRRDSEATEDVWCCGVVCDVISKHQGSIRRCRLSRFDHPLLHPSVDSLLETLDNKNIQELNLSFSTLNTSSGYLLPRFFLSCNTLLKLNLYFCRLPESAGCPLIFPKIVEVFLSFVSLDGGFITSLLSSPSLEKLHLYNCSGFQRIVVSSPNLNELVVKDHARLFGHVKETTIESAPNLKHLVLSETATMGTVVKIRHAPELKLLGFICLDLAMFQIGGGTFQNGTTGTVISGPRTVLPSVKNLAVRVDFSNEKQRLLMSSILKCFPFLETFDVKLVHHGTGKETSTEALWEKGGPFSFLSHLKKVTLKGFSEHQAVVAFANFLISSALVLKEMALLCSAVDLCYNKNWVEKRCRELCYKDRASQSLKIEFLEDWGSHPKFALWNLVLD